MGTREIKIKRQIWKHGPTQRQPQNDNRMTENEISRRRTVCADDFYHSLKIRALVKSDHTESESRDGEDT